MYDLNPKAEIKEPSKYELQRNDAAKRLGIKVEPVKQEVCVFLGSFSGESLTIAKAIKDLKPEITILGNMIGESVTFILTENGLIQGGSSSHPIYSLGQNDGIITMFHGNYGNFKNICGNKRLTSLILKNAGLPVPREIPLYFSDYCSKDMYGEREWGAGIGKEQEGEVTTKRVKHIKEFSKSLGEGRRVVIKPVDGQCGKNIHICNHSEITQELMHKDELSIEGDMLVQEKIDSYPLFDEDGNRRDWNVRALTTTDKNGDIKMIGVSGRIDMDGGPINRSISAENISLQEIAILGKWSPGRYERVKRDIEEIAIRSVEAIRNKAKQKNKLDSQDLAGVDIIIGEDFEPCVIEVNDSDSGCVYELMCLEGITRIYPLADAIIRKAEAGNDIMKLGKQFNQIFGDFSGRLTELIISNDIKVEDYEGGFSLVGITKQGIKYLEIMDSLENLRLEEKEKSL